MKKILIAVLLLLVAIAVSGVFAVEMPAEILFVGVRNGSSEIYIMRPGEENQSITQLTETSEKEGNACWWPRHSLILASREVRPDRYGLVALDKKGNTTWKLEDPFGSLGWPVPSPFDNRILCVRGLDNGFVQTGIVSYPDGEFEPFDFAGLSGGQLAWLSSEEILLSRVTAEGFSLSHRNLLTGEEKLIVSGGQNWQTHINQQSGRIFFVRRVGQTGSIFELFKDESGKWDYNNITNARTYDWQPSTSTDGSALIYRSLRDGKFSTIIRNLADGHEKRIDMDGFSQIYFPTIINHN